jgi:hypothetical protein
VNAESIVAEEPVKEAEDNRAREADASEAFAPLEPPTTGFGALLKAIEIWVQTR